ncbi:MAG: prenyltransferase [Chloroflexi bacterium]|nr:prenyltransferase [Chloroflexota bacterium]
MVTTNTFIKPMRPPLLILTPACVFLGLGAALWTAGRVDPLEFVLVLVGAVCAHISVNALNEYYDFKSGLDFKTQRTPFSGGSGGLPASPAGARNALTVGLGTLVIAAAIGVYFVFRRGLGLLPLGVLGLAVIYAYTIWLVRNPWTSLIAPGLGFGPLMVMGTAFALTGSYTWTAFFASLVPFFLVSDLLLLNQFPDAEADRSIGRRHFPILLGNRASSLIYGGFLLGSYLSIVAGILAGVLPLTALIGLATLALAIPAFRGSYQHSDDISKLVPAMGMNVLINVLTPILVAVGLLLSL